MFPTLTEKYLSLHPAEIRVVPVSETQARIQFTGFVGGNISQVIDLNQATTVNDVIKVYVGGQNDAFFNDLPGFFAPSTTRRSFITSNNLKPICASFRFRKR